MFASIYAHNFKCFDQLTVDFKARRGDIKQHIYIIGENGCGKSSVLAFFSVIRESIEALNNDVLLENITGQIHDINSIVQKYRKSNSFGNMVLAMEVDIKNQRFIYEIIFDDDNNIKEEILLKRINKNYNIIYIADQLGFNYGKGMIPKDELDVVDALYKKYFGSYSFGSILYYGLMTKQFKLKSTLSDFINYLGSIHVENDMYAYRKNKNLVYGKNINAHAGTCDQSMKQFLNASSIIMTEYLSSLFDRVVETKYQFKEITKGNFAYELLIKEKNLGKSRITTYEEWPKSYRQAVKLSSVLLNSYSKRPVIIDDIDEGFYTKTSINIIDNFVRQSREQTIFTISSPTVLDALDPRSLYICQYDEKMGHTVDCIDELIDIRIEHNLRNRYDYISTLNEYNYDPEFYKYETWFDETVMNKRNIKSKL